MPDQPKFNAANVTPKQSGWNAQVDDLISLLNQHLAEFPSQVRGAYRISGDNPDPDKWLNMVALDATIYEGHMVWVRDPGGANAPSGGVTSVTVVFSDGVIWRWFINGFAVAGIA